MSSIHKRKCYKDSFLSRIKRDTSQHIFFQQFILMKPSIKDNASDLGIFNMPWGSWNKPGEAGTMMGPIPISADE